MNSATSSNFGDFLLSTKANQFATKLRINVLDHSNTNEYKLALGSLSQVQVLGHFAASSSPAFIILFEHILAVAKHLVQSFLASPILTVASTIVILYGVLGSSYSSQASLSVPPARLRLLIQSSTCEDCKELASAKGR